MSDARRAFDIPEADAPELVEVTAAQTMYLVEEILVGRSFWLFPGLKKLNCVDRSQELRSRVCTISKYFLACGLVGHLDGNGINSGFSAIKYSGNSLT